MPDANPSPPDPARLRRLIAAYEQRRSAGRPVDEDDILRSYPDLAEGFRRYIERRSKSKPDDSLTDELSSSSVADTSLALPADLLPAGTLIDRYRIREVLGTGSMGIVYKADDERLGRSVALKIPDVRGHNREMFLKRFESEARVAAVLSHPSLCPILDFGTCDAGVCKQQPYLTMPVLPGPSLSQFVELEGAQAPADVVQLVRPIVEGLREMHEHGVTHRDLKPSNVLLDRRGRPVITDFGLARRDELASDVRLTNAAALMGSPAYCSPEQVRGDANIDPRSDLYSLGVLMYELLTGRLPFEGSVGEVLGAVLHVAPPPPSQLRPSLTSSMEDLCLALLHKDAAGRPQSAEEVLKRLEDPALLAEPAERRRWLQALRRVWSARKASVVAVSSLLLGTAMVAKGLRRSTDTFGIAQQDAGRASPSMPPVPAPSRATVPIPDEPAKLPEATLVPAVSPLPRVASSRRNVPAALAAPFLWQPPIAAQVAADFAADTGRSSMTASHTTAPLAADSPSPPAPPQNLFVNASSWLAATGQQDLTTWVPSPPTAPWQRYSDFATLLHPQPLPGKIGSTLWYPQPLKDFEFEFELSFDSDVQCELIFHCLAPSGDLCQHALRVPLTVPSVAPDGKETEEDALRARVVPIAGSLQKDRLQIRVDRQPSIELDIAALRTERPAANWHAVLPTLPDRGYFGVHLDGHMIQLAKMRVQAEAPDAWIPASICMPRVAQSIPTSLRGPVQYVGDQQWLQTDQSIFANLPNSSFACRFCIDEPDRNTHWSTDELALTVATGQATDFTLLGAATSAERTRVAFFGPDFVAATSLDGINPSLQLLDVPLWQHMARVFVLQQGRVLSYQQSDRSQKDEIVLWHIPDHEEPQRLAVAAVPKKLETLAATPDGSLVVFTVAGRLFECRRDRIDADPLALPGEFYRGRVQRIPWQVGWAALSPDGTRLALAVNFPTIWNAKLIIMDRGAEQWDMVSEFPLAKVFWDVPPPRTQRQFAVRTIQPHSLQWSPDGDHLLGTFSESYIARTQPNHSCAMVWTASGTKPLLRMPDICLQAAQFAEDSQHVLLVHQEGVARLWELPTLP